MDRITHQKLLDDTILPGESIVEEANHYKNIIKTYVKSSGQNFSIDKSEIFFLNTNLE